MRASEARHVLAALDRAVGSLCGAEVDDLDERGLTDRLDHLQRAQSRLAAERARLIAVLEQRRTGPIADPRQRERERQQLQRDLAGRSNRPPAATKLDAQAGRAAAEHTTTGRAFADGLLAAEHVRLIGEALDAIVDRDEREAIERELVELAGRVRPSVLGRHVRELLARRAPISVELREARQQRDRRFSMTPTPDGGLSVSGLLYGTAAETIRTALDAYRRPDVPGEFRTPGQRSADALEQLCAVALVAGEARARHGIRPQVLVTVTTDQLALGDDAIAHLASGEPTTLGRLRHLLDDCTWSRVVLAPNGTPIEASESVRTVPSGLWRALLARDGGCTWDGCDAPAAWCDVAHGQVPFAAGGRLSPTNAALLCRRHHRRFDHGGYRIAIDGGCVRYHRMREPVPPSPPRSSAGPGPGGQDGQPPPTPATAAPSRRPRGPAGDRPIPGSRPEARPAARSPGSGRPEQPQLVEGIP
ncbi:MAG: DUF222 domain-containing protein [Nitriliruptoraceae bacterium]